MIEAARIIPGTDSSHPMDVGMLAYFQGVAFVDAREEAREAAHHHIASNEDDGIARWIVERFLT